MENKVVVVSSLDMGGSPGKDVNPRELKNIFENCGGTCVRYLTWRKERLQVNQLAHEELQCRPRPQ